jgi:hypothetical protein
MPGEQEPTGTPPVQTPAPAPVAPPSQPPEIPPSSTALPDGTDWKAKYDGTRGAWMQAQTAWNEQLGAREEAIKSLRTQLQTANTQLTEAQNQIQTFTQQVEGIPQLEERAKQAETLEVMNQRLELIMKYPSIVNQTEVVEEELEVNGEKKTQQKRVNPVMDLLLSSKLQGDQYDALVAQMAGKFSAGEGAPAPPPGSPLVGTPPPSPAPSDEAGDLRKQIWEAREAGNHSMVNELMDQLADLQDKQAAKKS